MMVPWDKLCFWDSLILASWDWLMHRELGNNFIANVPQEIAHLTRLEVL